MGWRDNLHLDGKGSFRGIEFLVDSTETSIGRRTVLHEFPGRDRPYVEDLGRRARTFSIDAYLLGENYMADRDRLRDAIENNPNPALLVHPYYGELEVRVVGNVNIRETPREGGMARLRFQCVEAGDELPVREPDKAEELNDKADEAIASVKADFADEFDVIGFIAAVAEAAEALINGIVSDINKIKGYVNQVMGIVDSIGDAVEALADGVSSLILLPQTIAGELTSIVNGVVASVNSIGDAWGSYFDSNEETFQIPGVPATAPIASTPASGDVRVEVMLKAFRGLTAIGDDWDDVPTGTSQRTQEAANQSALENLMKTAAVVEACRALIDLPFSSINTAEQVRDELFVQLDSLIENASEDTYFRLVDLRVSVGDYLAVASAELPRLVEYRPKEMMPALLISQVVYGDSTREADIIARNNIRNPCKVPASDPIEVISDD